MTAAELLDVLESRALLPGEVLTTLRQQVERSIKIVTPESLAKLLVGKGLITAFQAEQLLASAKPAAVDVDEEFSLAPLDDDESRKSHKIGSPLPVKPAVAAPTAAASVAVNPTAAKPVAIRPAVAKPSAGQPAQAAAVKTATAPAAPTKPSPAANAKPVAAKPPVAKIAPSLDPFGLPAGAGPLDDLLGNPLLGDPLGESTAPKQATALRPAARRKKGIPTWIWFAASGAVALIGVIIAVVILTRSNGDAEWRLAEKDYQAGQDQDATQKLNAFLEAFPQHRQASLARVYLGLSRLRQAFASKTDFDRQLSAAQQVLPELVKEPEFPQARETLAKMLPDMAAGLAEQAQAFHGPLDQRHEKAEQARQGLALAEDWRFVPDKLKPWAALQATSDQVAQLIRDSDRSLDTDKALTAIRAAIAAGNGAEAFAVRDKLLQSYPELRQGAELDAVDQELTHSAPRLVKIDPQSRAAETKPRATPILATFTGVPCVAMHEGPAGQEPVGLPVADVKAASVAVLADGAVYWLQASNGAPRGRRFVGFDSVPPVAIPHSNKSTNGISDDTAGSTGPAATDWVVFDSIHKELACYGNGGSEFRWRQSTGDAIESAPLLIGRRLYVATRGGRLATIDADSGKWLSAAQFPEPLRAAPCASADGKTLYVAGDHGTLYFVSARDLTCSAAVDLEYGSGSVRLAPMVLGSYIVLVENSDWDGSDLRVVSLATADAPARAVQKVALPGQVVSPPVVVGKQLLLATDKGIVMAFDASGSGAYPLIKSLVKSIENQPAAGARQSWFLAVAGKQLWLAGNGLAHGDLGASAGAMQLSPDQFLGNRFEQSPLVEGDRVIATYRRSAGSGVWVAAINSTGKRQWQAVVAAPPIGEPMVNAEDSEIRLVIPPAGTVVSYPITAPLANRMTAAPLFGDGDRSARNEESLNAMRPSCADVDALPGGGLAAAFGTNAAEGPHLFFSTAKEPALRPSAWSDVVCSPPVALGKGLLVANSVGQICFVDAATGQSVAEAFQPRLVPDAQLTWRKPAVLPGKPEAILSDGGTHLYRLGIDEKPSAHLVALAEATLERPVVSDVAVNGELVFVVDDADHVTAVNVTDLKAVKGWSLGGRVAWGPKRVGDVVLVATSRELFSMDTRPGILWQMPLDAGAPVGVPLQIGDDLFLATADGFIERIDRKTGKTQTKVDLEQPLAAGPIAVEKKLAVVGQDGSVHIVPQP
jgi:TolA-binding protein